MKPSNILLTLDGRARLTDFGLAATEEPSGVTRTAAPIGTLHYMSPEQVLGARGLDAGTDVYGLGATLYQLLALQTPFHGEDRLAIERRILQGDAEPLRSRNRAVAVDVETVVRVAMDRDRRR